MGGSNHKHGVKNTFIRHETQSRLYHAQSQIANGTVSSVAEKGEYYGSNNQLEPPIYSSVDSRHISNFRTELDCLQSVLIWGRCMFHPSKPLQTSSSIRTILLLQHLTKHHKSNIAHALWFGSSVQKDQGLSSSRVHNKHSRDLLIFSLSF